MRASGASRMSSDMPCWRSESLAAVLELMHASASACLCLLTSAITARASNNVSSAGKHETSAASLQSP